MVVVEHYRMVTINDGDCPHCLRPMIRRVKKTLGLGALFG
jgi:hypothetical protein